jgi:hypothetical protein
VAPSGTHFDITRSSFFRAWPGSHVHPLSRHYKVLAPDREDPGSAAYPTVFETWGCAEWRFVRVSLRGCSKAAGCEAGEHDSGGKACHDFLSKGGTHCTTRQLRL